MIINKWGMSSLHIYVVHIHLVKKSYKVKIFACTCTFELENISKRSSSFPLVFFILLYSSLK